MTDDFKPKDWQPRAPDLFTGGDPVANSPDLQRILVLPRREPLDPASPRAGALVDYVTRKYARDRSLDGPCRCREIDPTRPCITRLLPIQAQALHEIALVNGLAGLIRVGGGKTLIDLLAIHALQKEDTSSGHRVFLGPVQCALLLVPPGLIDQLIVDYQLLREHFRAPSLIVHGSDYPTQIVPGAPVLHVLAYSRLSLPTSSDWIERVCRPEAIIADEADRLKDPAGAASSRLLRFFGNHGDTRFCWWTGSASDHSLSEFAHLMALALREGSPMPLDPEVVEDWGRALDAVDNPCPAGALAALVATGLEVTTKSTREGFGRRLAETPGVVMSGGDVVETSRGVAVDLIVQERKIRAIPWEVEEHLKTVRAFVRPDGEELVDALAMAKCAHEVASGLYYRWIFPRGEPREVILEWLAARKEWHRELRQKLFSREEWLDSPMLCERAAMRAWGNIPPAPPDALGRPTRPDWKAVHWPRWREVKILVKPKTEAVRIHDFLAQDAAQWAHEHRGIVWYGLVEFGQWVSEISGLPMHGGGPTAGPRIRQERGDRSIIASIKSHGRGRDGLQRLFREQLVANVPASATMWQQLLGRLFRRGQDDDEVLTWIYKHTPEVKKSFNQALRRATYVEEALRSDQIVKMGWSGDDEE